MSLLSEKKKPVPRLTEEEKKLNKAFRRWVKIPLHPDSLRMLAELMVSHELQARVRHAEYIERTR